jgi:glucokinase
MYLAADIGGTKAHLAIYQEGDEQYRPVREKKFASKEYPTLEKIVIEFMESAKEKLSKACFGIAGPIKEGKSETPNLPWLVDSETLKEILKIEKVALINDLSANGYGLNTLQESDYYTLNSGKHYERGNGALISAGTGLGQAGLLFHQGDYIPFASEGGHCDFLARNEEEIELFFYLKKIIGGHISIERALSGSGLKNIYHYVVDMKKAKTTLKEVPLAKTISEKALKKECPACEKALEIFIRFYGAEAGNLALRFFALGGIFLGGGIAPKNLELFKTPVFMEAFTSKGRMKNLLSTIPVKIILKEETALLGSAYYANLYL